MPVVLTLHDYKLVCPTYQFLDQGAALHGLRHRRPLAGGQAGVQDGSLRGERSRRGRGLAAPPLRRLRASRRFICPSRFLAGEMRRAGVFPDRVQVLDNFTDVSSVVPRDGAGSGIVYAGRLSGEKGVDLADRGVAALCTSGAVPDDVTMQVVGDGPERAALETLAQQAAPGRVVFHGRVTKDRVSELVRQAAATVAPSRWYENQPLAVLESFAAGVPVITTELGGLPEIVEDGTTGWLVDLEDRPALATALAEAVTQPEVSRARGTAARRVAEERFSPEGHVDAVEGLYRELVA